VAAVATDYDEGRAALRWFPDHQHAVESDPIAPIVVMESSDWDVVSRVIFQSGTVEPGSSGSTARLCAAR
jgi:hypothetical protein